MKVLYARTKIYTKLKGKRAFHVHLFGAYIVFAKHDLDYRFSYYSAHGILTETVIAITIAYL